MEENEFEESCEETLQSIANAIEAADEKEELDVDYVDGVMTIDFPNGSQLVLNRHRPTQKLWLSSPESGASYYEYDEDEESWIDGDNNELLTVLAEDIETIAGVVTDFD